MTRVHAVVFVIDSADRGTLTEAKTELSYLLKEEMLDHQPFLIFANKQDNPVSNTLRPRAKLELMLSRKP